MELGRGDAVADLCACRIEPVARQVDPADAVILAVAHKDYLAGGWPLVAKLLKGGEEVRMSKRTGNIVALADLLEEVDPDVARTKLPGSAVANVVGQWLAAAAITAEGYPARLIEDRPISGS